jgi:hypothetical protein
VADADFWRDLAAKFRALPNDYGMFCAEWRCVEGEPRIWTPRGTATVLAQFEVLAARAGAALDSESSDFRVTWLNLLRKESPNSRPATSGIEKRPDGTQARYVSGSIANVCEASANYCSELEGRALEAEFQERQENNPKNWSPLRRHWEALKEMKHLRSGPHEEMPETVVRGVLAEQYGIKPEEVTWKQIQFEVAGLLRRYPTIRIIPSQLGGGATPKDENHSERQSPFETAAQSGKRRDYDPVAAERANILNAFKVKARGQGIKVTDKMIAGAAKNTWNDRTMVTWWKRNDPRCKPPHDRLIRAVLGRDPSSVWPST